ncbi:MAG: type II secretion system protein [Gammaproteobacteria bacterium]
MVLVAVVITGLMEGVAATITSRVTQAEREKELLFRGLAYQNAIKSYYQAGKQLNTFTFPRSLNDLLKDPRFPSRRHIRALYVDPMGKGDHEWSVIRAIDGGITGVASASKQKSLKTANFPAGLESLAGKKSYAEWVFMYNAPAAIQVPLPARPMPVQRNR